MTKLTPEQAEPIVKKIEQERHQFESFLDSVETFFHLNPLLKVYPPVIHSIRTRIKDSSHLSEKIIRKSAEKEVSEANVFQSITDIAGIRVIHLHLAQFPKIHECIMKQVEQKHWALFEAPKAYTWDPETEKFFQELSLETLRKDSYYTSIHYVIQPKTDSYVTCEIQVRTLFEEAWGEIDHTVNYPTPTDSQSAKEQLRVLARMVGACSRLGDSVFSTVSSHKKP